MTTNAISHFNHRFSVIEELGSGSYGKVLKCYDREKEIIVATKIFHSRFTLENLENSINREKKILTSINHPNINKYLGDVIIPDQNKFILILEYCEYDLSALIYQSNRKNLTYNHYIYFMKQILESLDYLSNNNIIHRDIKPSNIFIHSNNTICLGDFGFSIFSNEDRQFTSRVATLNYRAPELILGSTRYGIEIDVWSAGCVFFELITGEMLFPSTQSQDFVILQSIIKKCGTPLQTSNWLNNCKSRDLIDNFVQLPSTLYDYLNSTLINEFKDFIPLLLNMLNIDPSKRLSPEELLKDKLFINIQKPSNLDLPEMHGRNIYKKFKNSILDEFSSPQRPILKYKF